MQQYENNCWKMRPISSCTVVYVRVALSVLIINGYREMKCEEFTPKLFPKHFFSTLMENFMMSKIDGSGNYKGKDTSAAESLTAFTLSFEVDLQ